MKNIYMLRLLPDGDIDIIKNDPSHLESYEIVAHKTYNPSETIKENLLYMYEEWEKLKNEK